MTSTEFTIGLEGSRNSSKVLKPPGGGSSDIFGTAASQFSSNRAEGQRNREAASGNTQNRLFGLSDGDSFTPSKKQNSSNIFGNQPPQPAKSSKKPQVRRNPITGEEYGIYPEYEKKENGEREKNVETENGEREKNDETENGEREKNDENGEDVKDNNVEQNGDTADEEKKQEVPTKPVTTSIRVRNPPGGKSSGIF